MIKEDEVWRGEMTCPRSYNQERWAGFDTRFLYQSQACPRMPCIALIAAEEPVAAMAVHLAHPSPCSQARLSKMQNVQDR